LPSNPCESLLLPVVDDFALFAIAILVSRRGRRCRARFYDQPQIMPQSCPPLHGSTAWPNHL
jgi:hypothetical protein